ncbi:MAG TPA: hypothetical protein VGE65_05845 [Sphingobium sp.]
MSGRTLGEAGRGIAALLVETVGSFHSDIAPASPGGRNDGDLDGLFL